MKDFLAGLYITWGITAMGVIIFSLGYLFVCFIQFEWITVSWYVVRLCLGVSFMTGLIVSLGFISDSK